MRVCWSLAVLGAVVLAGCSDPKPKDDPDQKTEKSDGESDKEKRISRFAFDDVDSNRDTGEVLAEKSKIRLVDPAGKEVDLASYKGKPVVLVFMRGFSGNICPYCTTYTAQIAARYADIKKAGAEVLVVYPTREEDTSKVDEFKRVVNEILEEDGKEAIPFPVFLDPGTRVVREYNLEGDLSKPSTFILDSKGEIQYCYVGKDTDDRPAVERILKEVRALTEQ